MSCASKRGHAGQPWGGPMTRLPFTPSSALMRVNPMMMMMAKKGNRGSVELWCQGGAICDISNRDSSSPASQPPVHPLDGFQCAGGQGVYFWRKPHFSFLFSNLSQLKWCQGLCWRRELWVRPSFQLQTWLQQPACKLLPRWWFLKKYCFCDTNWLNFRFLYICHV